MCWNGLNLEDGGFIFRLSTNCYVVWIVKEIGKETTPTWIAFMHGRNIWLVGKKKKSCTFSHVLEQFRCSHDSPFSRNVRLWHSWIVKKARKQTKYMEAEKYDKVNKIQFLYVSLREDLQHSCIECFMDSHYCWLLYQ